MGTGITLSGSRRDTDSAQVHEKRPQARGPVVFCNV